MFTLRMSEVKANFFDRIKDPVDKARIRSLSRAGTIIRRRARRITNRKAKTARSTEIGRNGLPIVTEYLVGAPAGEPPRKRTGALRDGIVFAYDSRTQSVVVGPVRLARRGRAPEILELGGPVLLPARDADGRPLRNPRGRILLAERRLEPRPYMRRSLLDVLDALPEQWRDSIGGV